MASLGMFGGSAPRIRRLQPMGNQFGPSIEDMRAQSIAEMQAGQAANENMLQNLSNSGGRNSVPKPGGAFGLGPQGQPAPAPQAPSQAMSTDVATSSPKPYAFMQGPGGQPAPTSPAAASGVPAGPVDAKKAIPVGDGPSGYSVGKRDWWGEVSKDPMFYLFNGQAGLDERRNEGIMADYARQAAEESAQKRQREREEIVQLLGPQAGIAYDQNPTEFGKTISERFGTNVLNQGDVLDRGIDTPESRFAVEPKQTDANNIRQVGNSIVERQQDGSWKPVYTGSSPAETARAFQGFIDQATGEQMLVMSDGTVRGTNRNAYVPPQISSVGGVPVAVDKRTFETTQLSPLADVAGNKASIASAEVQGKAQGQVAFDLPVIEQRAQTAMSSIADLKGRDIGTRFGMQGKLYAIPGTDGANVQAVVNQVTSQAFLNAFEQLKGGGAITEREGQAATQAITRLQNQNITVGEALKAMDELQGYYRKGLEVARQRAVKAPVLPGRPGSSAGATRTREGVPFLLAKPQNMAGGIPDGVDPADWEFMTPEQKALFQ